MPYAMLDSQTDALLSYCDDCEHLMAASDGEWYITQISTDDLIQRIAKQKELHDVSSLEWDRV